MPTKIPIKIGIFTIKYSLSAVKILEFDLVDLIQKLDFLKSSQIWFNNTMKLAGEELNKVNSHLKIPRFALPLLHWPTTYSQFYGWNGRSAQAAEKEVGGVLLQKSQLRLAEAPVKVRSKQKLILELNLDLNFFF